MLPARSKIVPPAAEMRLIAGRFPSVICLRGTHSVAAQGLQQRYTVRQGMLEQPRGRAFPAPAVWVSLVHCAPQ